MSQRLTDSRLANIGAKTIQQAFDTYHTQFEAITQQAKSRFEKEDWHGMQENTAKRLGLYRRIVDLVEAAVRDLLAERLHNKLIWAGMKAVYSGLIVDNDNWELAETFYNSITRRVFTTVGVDPQIEFVATDFETPPTPSKTSVYRTYRRAPYTTGLVEQIINDCEFETPFANLSRDAQLVADQIKRQLLRLGALRTVERAEIVRHSFYRGMGAYLVGRLFSGSHLIPLVLSLIHTPKGIVIDSVLLDEDAVSILFSFTRSYFHVEVERPYDLVQFLHTIMPRKRIAELYISVGYNKHGKTELYRDLLQHLVYSDDQFEAARGQRGMVMMVFDMPSYDMVFKVIKDHFNYPKDATRKDVMAKYDLVHRHDRAGRLVDAQSFEYLQFERGRFSEELIAELLEVASETVSVMNDHVVVKHAYVQRRVFPLDIYVREAAENATHSAVRDYGRAIKDLANCNIFPGDMLLKNFGVTRHGRVVFYDFDELCFLLDCNFRRMPPAFSYDDELAAEPWFHVNEGDIFPEEFAHFLGLSNELRASFTRHHGDLFTAVYWRKKQGRLKAGELIHIFPYKRSQRLHAIPPNLEPAG
jgi:isocitrate dehydrogenase kinase/phosphatase